MSKIVLLDNIRSMQNVGAIFRNADGAGFEKLLLTGYTPYPPRNDISKTALGGERFIDREYFQEVDDAIEWLKNREYQIWCVELTSDAIDYKKLFSLQEERVCLVMGNEVNGVQKKLLKSSNKNIIIPMRGKKESLNVSVAAGIVMYSVN